MMCHLKRNQTELYYLEKYNIMKVLYSKIVCLIFVFISISCINSINQINKNEAELFQKLKKGDISSYNDLRITRSAL